MKSPQLMMGLLAHNRYRNAISCWESLALARLSLFEKHLAKQWTMQMKATGAHYYHAPNHRPWLTPSIVLLNGSVVKDCQSCLTGPNGWAQIFIRNGHGYGVFSIDGEILTKTLHGHVTVVPGHYQNKQL